MTLLPPQLTLNISHDYLEFIFRPVDASKMMPQKIESNALQLRLELMMSRKGTNE